MRLAAGLPPGEAPEPDRLHFPVTSGKIRGPIITKTSLSRAETSLSVTLRFRGPQQYGVSGVMNTP
jgi:hypothetical protein